MTRPTVLSDAARDALTAATLTDTSIALPPTQLERDVYKEVEKVLKRLAGGGRYRRIGGCGAYTYQRDPRADLAAILDGGATEEQVSQFFRTPADLADDMASRLDGICRDAASFDVLEPSAGDGALVKAVHRRHGVRAYIEAVEPNAQRAIHIAGSGARVVYPCTFEDFHQHIACQGGSRAQFDAVVMNPPFKIDGDSLAWVEHVTMAWDLLRPGGRLLAIVPISLTFRDDKRVQALRERIAVTDDGGWEELPENTFAGTGVRAVLLDVPL